MPDPREVAALVEAFRPGDDGEAVKSRDLVLALLALTTRPFARDQFAPGHLTASGVVLDAAARRFLLVYHRRLDRWLLPGGHVEPQDQRIWDTARREVEEETGVLLVLPGAERLAGIDVHGIPGKPPEPYHLHHDLVFTFRAAGERLRPSGETRAVLWSALDEFDRYQLPASTRRAVLRAVAGIP